jgi:hypothetical protein
MKNLLVCNFRAELLTERPSNDFHLRHFSAKYCENGKDGLIVKIIPTEQDAWVGMFEFGDEGETGIYSTANPDVVCVVSKGVGYFVNSRKPAEWSIVPVLPIIGVFQIPSEKLLAFNNFTEVYAWDANGPIWQTQSLASDDVNIETIEKGMIIGRAYKYGKPIRFSINAKNGKIISSNPVV